MLQKIRINIEKQVKIDQKYEKKIYKSYRNLGKSWIKFSTIRKKNQ